MPCEDQNRARASGAHGPAYGCLFCRTGNELQIGRAIERDNENIQTLFAEKLRKRRIQRAYVEEREPLFPGYLFFRTSADFEAQSLSQKPDVYRLLYSESGDWRLYGSDERFAQNLFEENGLLGFSRAYYEGDRIRIVDGPLKAYEGRIIRVNRRTCTAQVRLSMCGRETCIWLGFELMEEMKR